MSTVSESEKRYTVLLVDDEESILSSLRRVLRGKPYDLLLATSGGQALGLFELHHIDLIVSDARMPGMDGPTLLSQVYQRDPECMNILLTGYADLSMITKAINEGHIFRYISKPWNDEELRLTLERALEMQSVRRDRDNLLGLIREQNNTLRDLTDSLERRGNARTAELQQTAEMRDLAYDELRHSYITSTEAFSLMVNQRLPRVRQINQRVIEVVRAYCAHNAFSEADTRNLSMAAALYNIGKLDWSDQLLQDANNLIRHHQEHWDGSGFPDHLMGQAIPLGARVLKLAVDYVELQCALVLDRYLTCDEVLVHLRHNKSRLYDPGLIEPFIEVCTRYLPENFIDPSVKVMDVRRLQPDGARP